RSSWKSWSLSILLHLAIVVIAVGYWLWSKRNPEPQRLAIQGTVVSSVEVPTSTRAVEQPLPQPEDLPPEPEPEPEPLPEEPLPPEEDPAVLQAQAEAERVAEQQRVATEQRLAEEQRTKREAEQRV